MVCAVSAETTAVQRDSLRASRQVISRFGDFGAIPIGDPVADWGNLEEALGIPPPK